MCYLTRYNLDQIFAVPKARGNSSGLLAVARSLAFDPTNEWLHYQYPGEPPIEITSQFPSDVSFTVPMIKKA